LVTVAGQLFADLGFQAQFLGQLAAQSSLRAFLSLGLASRELPLQTVGVVGPAPAN
jgi:hypothetical protein